MKKLITACLIASTIAFSPAIRALESLPPQELADESNEPTHDGDEAPSDSTTPPEGISPETPSDSTPPDDTSPENDEGTPVGQAANEGTSAAKRKQWQNIALAVAAVVVAVTALILIANNEGHKD